ncbi:metal ABC transporter permease [Allopusillimonas soli]|uniref:Metal ABC transporter permease n=1 Tax=Allopusillimonas soli TaxID=659016 RepID=A0A853F631_9BURK|nr:metal ABC transporter permease [Allopusillimonas soli]NYT35439.1 metal ABC transporter permease [Allopusillimonas soli]TEA75854.1 metal ABC transporter permease [Allopusillimonas soli]
MSTFLSALLLQAGYNTAVVCIGAAMLGAACGTMGVFILLRRQSLASDAAGHATLPGLALAFIIMALAGGNGRWLPGLMAGAALSAALGLLAIHTLSRHTRLGEDAAIGAVLSVFFGAGAVLMSVVQALQTGRQAGLSHYLLGSAASMLRAEAELVAMLALVAGATLLILRRPLAVLCFDAEYARVLGLRRHLLDLSLSALLLALVVTSLKLVGLVLSVALIIMPAVTARFWANRLHHMVPASALTGAIGAYVGAALSSVSHNLPTGALIVLALFGLFLFSLLLAPARGLLATLIRYLLYRRRVHRRQGLLAIGRREPIYDGFTLRLLRRTGWIRKDGVPTQAGIDAANAAGYDEALWALHSQLHPGDAAALQRYHVLPISRVLPPDALRRLEQHFLALHPGSKQMHPHGY